MASSSKLSPIPRRFSLTPHIGTETMTYDKQKPELDSVAIILGLGYATSLIVIIVWVATLVL